MTIVSQDENESNNEVEFLKVWSSNNYYLNNNIIRLYSLVLIKISFKKFFDYGLDFMIYYWLNFNYSNKIYLIFILKFVTEFCQFLIKLPIETILHRYQINYLINDNQINKQLKLDPSKLIIDPIDVNTSKMWTGLWNGWKIGLTSLICGFGFKLMNKLDKGLEQEQF